MFAAAGAHEALEAAGRAVNHLTLESPAEIRRAVPKARQAAVSVKSRTESSDWRTGDFTGLPLAIFQNWLYEQNREWHFTDGTLAVLWCVELPHAQADYAEKHHYVASTRRDYNAGRHQAAAPPVPCVGFDREGNPLVRAAAHAGRQGVQSRTVQVGHASQSAVPPAASLTPAKDPPTAPAGFRFASDAARTRQRVAALDAYMNDHVLTASGFRCSSFTSCKQSHLGEFFEGQLHHVGSHYDVSLNAQPFRIVVVGQEYGNGPALVTRDSRTNDVSVLTGRQKRFRTEGLLPGRNPHMRGTTSVLRLLFGTGLGADYQGEHVLLDGEPVHVFDAFALTNFLLCSAIESGQGDTGSKRGKSTRTMQENCARHFTAAMQILEPTVMIVQGQGVRRWLQPVANTIADIAPAVERVRIGGREMLLASFTHPSTPRADTNWGTDERRPYLLGVVRPAVAAIHAAILSAGHV